MTSMTMLLLVKIRLSLCGFSQSRN